MNLSNPNYDKINELKYYFKFCLQRPSAWPQLVNYILKRYLRLRGRLFHLLSHKNRLYNYPLEIRKEVQKIAPGFCLTDNWIDQLPSTGWAPAQGPSLQDWSIPLATYSLPFDQLNWFKDEPDQEDTFASHRFIWLLRWLSLNPSKEYLAIADATLQDWIEQIGPQKHLPAWETYSASERVVNWLLYLCATKNYRNLNAQIAQTIAISLQEHLFYITQQLEYYDNFYNNHILNNARSLYIGGRLLQLPLIANVGRIIFQKHIREMIDEKGALLEDSSHYQLLLTRTFIEVLWAAQVTGDTDFAHFLEPTVQVMTNCCLYLGKGLSDLGDHFPRVGDVSPDAPTLWFYPDIRFSQKGTWWGIWDVETMSSLIKGTAATNEGSETASTEWRWLSTTDNNFRVFVHTPQNLKTYPRGHGHLDFGGFLLYDESGPLLVDRGRSSYKPERLGLYGISARAHNTAMINGLPLVPSCIGPFVLYKEYLNKNTIKIDIEDGSPQLSWYTKAVNRLGRSLSWERNLSFHSGELEIEDIVSNPNQIALIINSHLHWAPEFLIPTSPLYEAEARNSFVIERPPKKYILKIDCSETNYQLDWFKGGFTDLHGWHFSEYGHKIPALTLQISIQTNQSFTLKFNICPL